jgi:hypothetical protein
MPRSAASVRPSCSRSCCETVEQHHLGAIAAGGRDLGLRCVLRHQDQRRHAQQARRQRDRLGMVAAGERDHAGPALRRIEARQRIEGSAELEGAHALEVLALEEDFGAQARVQRRGAQHRCGMGMPLQPARGGHDIGKGRKVRHG